MHHFLKNLLPNWEVILSKDIIIYSFYKKIVKNFLESSSKLFSLLLYYSFMLSVLFFSTTISLSSSSPFDYDYDSSSANLLLSSSNVWQDFSNFPKIESTYCWGEWVKAWSLWIFLLFEEKSFKLILFFFKGKSYLL